MEIKSQASAQVEAYLVRMKASGAAETTVKRHAVVLRELLKSCELLDLREATGDHMTRIVLGWRNRLRITTVATNVKILNQFFRQLFQEMPSGKRQVFTTWFKPKVDWWNDVKHADDDMLTLNEIEQLAASMPDQDYRDFVLLLFDSGARVNELRSINFKNVQVNGQFAQARVKRKTGWGRIYFMHDAYEPHKFQCDVILNRHIKAGTCFKDKVKYTTLILYLRRAARKLGINKPVHPHWFRHSRNVYLELHGLTQAHRKFYFGWSKRSNQDTRYQHMNLKLFLSTLGLRGSESYPAQAATGG